MQIPMEFAIWYIRSLCELNSITANSSAFVQKIFVLLEWHRCIREKPTHRSWLPSSLITPYPPAFHHISITLPFWCRSFYHHFMCQDNFSRYSIFFSFFKFNFNFGITYLFVRDGIEQAPFSPSIDIYIYSHRKKAEKYIKLKNSHVEITRTIWFEYGIMFVPMPGLTCANSFEITQRRGKKKQLNDNSCVHVYVWVPFVYGWSFIAQIRAIMIMTTILINRRRTIW